MANGQRQSNGRGRVAASEYDFVLGQLESWRKDGSRAAVIYCHGATGTAASVWADANEQPYIRALADHFTVLLTDLGGDTYGNDTAIARVAAAVAYLEGSWGINQPVLLTGNSMGTLVSLAYTLANPTKVAAVALGIPATDVNDIVTNNRLGLASAVNAAYGGTYDNAVHGPTHNPVVYGASLPSALPIGLWTSSNDNAAVPATADAFVALRPQTQRTVIGAVGHSTASLTSTTRSQMLSWLIAHKP